VSAIRNPYDNGSKKVPYSFASTSHPSCHGHDRDPRCRTQANKSASKDQNPEYDYGSKKVPYSFERFESRTSHPSCRSHDKDPRCLAQASKSAAKDQNPEYGSEP
ncbi:hypothetical protein KI387_004957, partial [Taxus chinensis]